MKSERRQAAGSQVEVLIMGDTGDTLVSVGALVRHARPVGSEEWVFGCQFARSLGDAEAAALWPDEDEPSPNGGSATEG